MASNDDLEFPFDTNSFLFLDSAETFGAVTECQENPSLLDSENEHNEIVGLVPVSAATNDVYHSSLIENPRTDQETLTRNSSFDQEIVTPNQSLNHEDGYSRSFNALEISSNVPSCTFRNGQRESVYSENCLLTSTNKAMSTDLQESVGLQHGNRSYQQPLLSQTNPNFFKEPCVPTMMGSNVQQVERTNGLTNFNSIYGLRDHRLHPSLFQEEQYDLDLLLEQLKHIHENDQMQQPESSNRSVPPYVEALPSNQHQIPYASSSNTIPNLEYRTPMISDTQILPTPENYSPFAHTSYQSDPFAFNFQNSSLLKTTRRTRGRPRKNQIPMPLVPATHQTLLNSPRQYGTQNKGKQPITTMPSSNPTLNNQCQNSYTNTMNHQSGALRQRSCHDHQLENECSSSKIRRIMLPCQEKSIADSSTVSCLQDVNMRSSAAGSNHEERSIKNTVYDPLYAGVGLPIDPHLRTP